MNLPAIPTDAVLGTIPLTLNAREWRVRRKQHKHIREALSGKRRQQLAVAPAGGPAIVSTRNITLTWQSLKDLRPRVEQLLAMPGPHPLILWRQEFLAFPGNGNRTEWALPWPVAIDYCAPPGGLQPSRFELEAKDPTETDYTVQVKSTVDYDAGAPLAGELWREQAGTRIKVLTAPAPGEYVHVAVVPRYQVLEGEETEAAFRDPAREPRNLVLLEA